MYAPNACRGCKDLGSSGGRGWWLPEADDVAEAGGGEVGCGRLRDISSVTVIMNVTVGSSGLVHYGAGLGYVQAFREVDGWPDGVSCMGAVPSISSFVTASSGSDAMLDRDMSVK